MADVCDKARTDDLAEPGDNFGGRQLSWVTVAAGFRRWLVLPRHNLHFMHAAGLLLVKTVIRFHTKGGWVPPRRFRFRGLSGAGIGILRSSWACTSTNVS
jgi:hypothetical protein